MSNHKQRYKSDKLYSVIVHYISKMKTTFDLNFDLNQAVKQHG